MDQDAPTLHRMLVVAATVTLPIAWGLLVEWLGRVIHDRLSGKACAKGASCGEGASRTNDEGGADA